MHTLAALALLLPALAADSAPAREARAPASVAICSLAAGDCRSAAAAELDPTRWPAGPRQVAYVDPVTGAFVEPTREQLAATRAPLVLREQARLRAAVETIRFADGTVVAVPAGGFLVELWAEAPAGVAGEAQAEVRP